MGKAKRNAIKNSIYEKLVESFNRVVAPCYGKACALNVDRFEKLLVKNKNKRGFASDLSRFYAEITAKDESASELEFDPLVLNNESMKRLFRIIKKDSEDNPAKDSVPKESIELSTALLAISSSAETAVQVVSRSVANVAHAVIKAPLSSLKALTVLSVYALAGQPVAGMRLSKRSTKPRYINDMLMRDKADWFYFYDHIETMIEECETYSITQQDKRLFFKFLEIAFASGAQEKLSTIGKNKLFELTKKELNESYDLTKLEDIKTLYSLFNVFLRVDFFDHAPAILAKISQYAETVASNAIRLDKKVKWDFTNFFWVLNINFNRYAKNLANFDTFRIAFDSLQKLNNEIYRWDKATIFSFRTVLAINYRLRQHFKENPAICQYLDEVTKNFVDRILKLVESQCFMLTANEIKESVYIQYVRHLAEHKKQLFTEIYQSVEKNQVFPHSYRYQIPNTGIIIHISYQQLSSDEQAIIEKAINNTYQRVEKLKAELGLSSKHALQHIVFGLHIFETHEEYVKYGPLWGVNTAGGGYAHVRSPTDKELPFYHRAAKKDELWNECFIYRQEGDMRNGKNKEGGSFRNLGHEIQHTLFYALVGQHKLDNLPSWMIEGGANALGNEACFKEEADYIKGRKDKLPTVERIINMSYANGADLYYFGSALFRFILEKYPVFLAEMITEAQQGKKIETISIKNWATPAIEPAFSTWLAVSIQSCSIINSVVDEQENTNKLFSNDHYLQDLAKNPNFLQMITQQGVVEFVFHDTIFVMEAKKITRYVSFADTKISRNITLSDYHWLKEALTIYVIENKFQQMGQTEKVVYEKMTQELVNYEGQQYAIRHVLVIKNKLGEELRGQPEFLAKLEGFVLNSSGLSRNLKQRLQQAGKINSDALGRILQLTIDGDSQCILPKEYTNKPSQLTDFPIAVTEIIRSERSTEMNQISSKLRSEKLQALSSVNQEYQRDLAKNRDFFRILQHVGAIKFSFPDIIFLLDASSVKGYSNNPERTTEIIMSMDDYNWLMQALQIRSIENQLQNLGKTEEIRKSIIQKLCGLAWPQANRQLQAVTDSHGWVSENKGRFEVALSNFVLNITTPSVFIDNLKQRYSKIWKSNNPSLLIILYKEIDLLKEVKTPTSLSMATMTASVRKPATNAGSELKTSSSTERWQKIAAVNTSQMISVLPAVTIRGVTVLNVATTIAVSAIDSLMNTTTPTSQDLTSTHPTLTETDAQDKRWILPTIIGSLVVATAGFIGIGMFFCHKMKKRNTAMVVSNDRDSQELQQYFLPTNKHTQRPLP